MDFFWAFVVGGFICVLGQLLLDVAKLDAGHVMSTFVVLGCVLDGFDLYDNLLSFAGAGASVPITSFGHSLLHGAMEQADKHGFWGIALGMFQLTSAGIAAAILFGFLVSVFFKPRG